MATATKSVAGNSSSAATNAAATNSAASTATAQSSVQEFSIRVPKNLRKKYHVMRFNATLNVDFAQWRNVKLERENNMREFRGMDEDTPKFGAGSEYNRDLREEVRRKKFGITARKYRPDAQPYILKVGNKGGKKFKGIREGGVGENAAFYVFTHAPDGAIEAYPLNEWYNFQPIQRYKALSAEEAEQEFGRRRKVMNYFSLMLRKRLKKDEEEEQDPDEVKIKGAAGKKSKELKISDMDEWIDSDEDSGSEEDEAQKKKAEDSDEDGGGGKKKGKQVEKKKKKKDDDEEAFEDSDDGDEEGREMDYDTESSESEPEPEVKLKSVAEEDALRKLLTSDEEEEDEKKSDESDKEDEKEKQDKNKDGENGKDKKKKSKQTKDDKKDSSVDVSSDSSDFEDEPTMSSNSKKKIVKDNQKTAANANASRSVTPTATLNNDANKRKFNNMPSDLTGSENSNSPIGTPAKRNKTDTNNTTAMSPVTFLGSGSNNKDEFGITEEAVRRYLMRKPMTATELLTKFKNKKTGVSSERLVETMTQILKRINPIKQTIQGKMYLSIKPSQ